MDLEYKLLQQTRKLTPGKEKFLKESLPDKATRTVQRAFYDSLVQEKKDSDERSREWLKKMLGKTPSGPLKGPPGIIAPPSGVPREEVALDGSGVPKEVQFRGQGSRGESLREKLARLYRRVKSSFAPEPSPSAAPSSIPSGAPASAPSPQAPGPGLDGSPVPAELDFGAKPSSKPKRSPRPGLKGQG